MSDVSIIRCGQCNKPFNKATTHRSDSAAHQQITTQLLSPEDPVTEDLLEDSIPSQVSLNNTFPLNQDFLDIGTGDQNWHLPEYDFEDFLHAQSFDDTVYHPFSTSPPTSDQTLRLQQQTISPSHPPPLSRQSIPASLSSTPRSLNLRSNIQSGTHRTATLLFHNLKSYPLMMLRQGTLPPFIHPKLTAFSGDGNENDNSKSDRMEPLTNCISLMHMIGSRVRGSRKLFWRNVKGECERLCGEILQLDNLELLAGMQALCIYILIRLDEGETEHNNLDSLMVKTVIVIATQLALQPYSPAQTNNQLGYTHEPAVEAESSWKQWLFEESRRRLAVVYRILNMLIYFAPSGLCTLQADLILAPLPASKGLWEAPNQASWNALTSTSGSETEFGLASDGELVKLQDGQRYCGNAVLLYKALGSCRAKSENEADGKIGWEEWCLGMDGFGGLVMLAATLVG
ncbi:hypothetical protein VTL71DRAFT_5919 [Oculimacula yallundae]|uniref:C2H2-type domain-containing protein n=1 Tax=Oculimacula yallundae TaxID=86028 RepID=A0ABR4BZK4_9HELO